jgi:hypothetical protein
MNEDMKVLLASVPLLSSTDQQAFFDEVRAMQTKAIQTALNRIAGSCANVSVEKRVARYIALRDARAAANREADTLDGNYKAAMEAIEKSLIVDAQSQGVTGFTTDAGTTYMDTRMMASIADDKAFYEFVRASGDLDFFERRLKATHIKEWQDNNEGRLPPGLNVFREVVMKVRRK